MGIHTAGWILALIFAAAAVAWALWALAEATR